MKYPCIFNQYTNQHKQKDPISRIAHTLTPQQNIPSIFEKYKNNKKMAENNTQVSQKLQINNAMMFQQKQPASIFRQTVPQIAWHKDNAMFGDRQQNKKGNDGLFSTNTIFKDIDQVSSIDRISTRTNQTKTSKFFSFFEQQAQKSKLNFSQCSQIFKQKQKQKFVQINNKNEKNHSYFDNSYINSNYDNQNKKLNKTQIFVSNFNKQQKQNSLLNQTSFRKSKIIKIQFSQMKDQSSSDQQVQLRNLIKSSSEQQKQQQAEKAQKQKQQPVRMMTKDRKLFFDGKFINKQVQLQQTSKAYQQWNKNKEQQVSAGHCLAVDKSHISDNLQSSYQQSSTQKSFYPKQKVIKNTNNFATKQEQNKNLFNNKSINNQEHKQQQWKQQNQQQSSKPVKKLQQIIKQPSISSRQQSDQELQQSDEQLQQSESDEQLQQSDEQLEQSSYEQEFSQYTQSAERSLSSGPFQLQQRLQTQALNLNRPVQQPISNPPVQQQKQIIIGILCFKTLTQSLIKQFEESKIKYYPSNYFHVGPRRSMFNFLKTLIIQTNSVSHLKQEPCLEKYYKLVVQIRNLLNLNQKMYKSVYEQIFMVMGIEIKKFFIEGNFNHTRQFLDIYEMYNCSNYFHVDRRRYIFSLITEAIKILTKAKKSINQSIQQQIKKQNQEKEQEKEREKEKEKESQKLLMQQKTINKQTKNKNQVPKVQIPLKQQQREQIFSHTISTIKENKPKKPKQQIKQQNSSLLFSNFLNTQTQSFFNEDSTQNTTNIFASLPPQISTNQNQQNSLQNLKSLQIGKHLKKIINSTLIASLQKTMIKYNGSNYFHVDARYELLGLARNFTSFLQITQKSTKLSSSPLQLSDIRNQKIIKAGRQARKYFTSNKIKQIQNTCAKYYSSNYFHVGPRYQIFSDVKKIIQISQQLIVQ